MTLKWAILNEYLNLWYFKCVLMLIRLYFYLSLILSAGLFCNWIFLQRMSSST